MSQFMPKPAWQGDKACETDPKGYFLMEKSEREHRLHYMVQYYQHLMKTGSLNNTQGLRYIKLLKEWQKEFAKNKHVEWMKFVNV